MPTTADKTLRLETLRYYATRYEVVATSPTGEPRLVAYTSRHSGRGLLSILANSGSPELLAHVAPTDDGMSWGDKRMSLIFPGGGSVSFSGRTQRDALNGDELPTIAAACNGDAARSTM